MPSVFGVGVSCWIAGLRLIFRPELRLFVLLPLSLNILVFSGLLYLSIQQFEHWLAILMPSLPDWLLFLEYLLWPIFVLLLLVIVFFTFTLVANFLAAPFNGLLSERVERLLDPQASVPEFQWAEFVAVVPHSMAREWQKLSYFIPRVLGLLLLSVIPVVNLVATPLWLTFGVWMMAVQYLDYPADNHRLNWGETLAWIRARRWKSFGLGGTTYAALLVPGFNLLVMPAAVAGATVLWVQEQQQLRASQSDKAE